MAILTEAKLAGILAIFCVPTENWGTGKAKRVGDLLAEINTGESCLRLDRGGIMRVTEIVKIHFLDPSNFNRGTLKELFHVFPDGRKRERNQELSGKIKTGETPNEALLREVWEEFGLRENDLKSRQLSSKTEFEESRSYPGLPCCYIIHLFEVTLHTGSILLPDEFETRESDGTVLHFKWVAEK